MEPVVFDIDLDFFLDKRSEASAYGSRPADWEYEIWDDSEVVAFMVDQLGLDGEKKPRAFRCETHDEVLYACMRLHENGYLQKPFRLLHIDAHDDLDSYRYAIRDATARHRGKGSFDVKEMEKREEVNETSYVCYLIALGMLSEYEYVHLADSDLPSPYLLSSDGDYISIGVLEEPYEEYGEEYKEPRDFNDPIIAALYSPDKDFYETKEAKEDKLIESLPRIRYRHWDKEFFFEEEEPVFLFLSRSPRYTPSKADRLICDCIAPLVDFEAGEKLLKSLGQEFRFKES